MLQLCQQVKGVAQMFWRNRRQESQVRAELESLNQQYEKLKEEQVLLMKAIALMGLNPTAIIDELRPGGDPFLQALPFRMATVVLDVKKAGASGLSENMMVYAVEGLDRVRISELRPPSPMTDAALSNAWSNKDVR